MEAYEAMAGLVESATNESLHAPDESRMKEVSDLIRSRADMPKHAINQISKILEGKTTKNVQNKNQVLYLAFELLEYISYTCECNLYNFIATQEFCQKVGAKLKTVQDQKVVQKILQVIQCWHTLFQKDLHPVFFQFYQNVALKFPVPANYESRYRHLKSVQKPVNQIYGQHINDNNNFPVVSKYQKLKKDFDQVKENIKLANQMIDNHDYNTNVKQNEPLVELIQIFKSGVEENLRKTIESIDDEQLLNYCIQVNDDLMKTYERFKCLQSNKRPPPFHKQADNEDIKQISQIENKVQSGFQQQGYQQQPPIKLNPPGYQQPQKVEPPKQIANEPNLLDLDDDPVPIQTKPVIQQPQQLQQPVNLIQQAPIRQNIPLNQPIQNQIPPKQNSFTGLPGDLFVNPQVQQQQQQPKPQVNISALYNQPNQNQFAYNNQYYQQNPMYGQQPQFPNQFQAPQIPNNQIQNPQMQFYTQQQQQQQPKQDKYSAFEYVGGQNFGINSVPPQQNQYGYQQPVMNMTNPNLNNNFAPQQNLGYAQNQQNQNFGKPNSQQSFGQEKKAFDDLDDMFGLGQSSNKQNNQNSGGLDSLI